MSTTRQALRKILRELRAKEREAVAYGDYDAASGIMDAIDVVRKHLDQLARHERGEESEKNEAQDQRSRDCRRFEPHL
jgi:hypothetical protein